MTAPALRHINRMFILFFKNGKNNPTRCSSDKLYMLLIEIKDFNVLIHNKLSFDQPVKPQEANKKFIEISRNNDYKTKNILDFSYHQNYHQLLATDFPRENKI